MPKRLIVWGLKSAIDRLTRFLATGSQSISQIFSAVKALTSDFANYIS
jgi:hypothetical protein